MRLFGLIGFPLSHSFSASYFERKFIDENISDASYRLFPLEDISLILPFIHENTDLQGFNVTIPFKVSVLPYLDRITTEASAVGAVNCIKVERNMSGISLTGYNTDVYGFRESLLPALKPYHRQALVLGTGGAAKAVCYTLHELGIAYTMVSRSGKEDSELQYSQLSEDLINDNLLIINATPVGMYPETSAYPHIPYQFLGKRHLLFDLVYNPSETRFLQLGRQMGTTTMNGQKMLEQQALKSWEIWNM
jgi:shikimate dehydrogenase